MNQKKGSKSKERRGLNRPDFLMKSLLKSHVVNSLLTVIVSAEVKDFRH